MKPFKLIQLVKKPGRNEIPIMLKAVLCCERRSLLLRPLESSLPPVFFDTVGALKRAADEFRAVPMEKLQEEDSIRFGVGRTAGYRHMLARLDGIFGPAEVGEIQSAVEFDDPLHGLA